MENIPVRNIFSVEKESNFSKSFSIREVEKLLPGKDIIHEIHRHNFFYILALKKGAGDHEIDFTSYEVHDHSIFFMRPGQVHQHTLKAGSTGYLMQFEADLYHPHDKESNQILRKVSGINLYQPDAISSKKLLGVLSQIFEEYTDRQEGYQEAIKANLRLFFVELARQNNNNPSHTVNRYTQERLEEFLELLEVHIAHQKQVSGYADRLNLSPYQLNAVTKTALGKTCSEVINEHIILEAKRYLLATSNQITQIAYHLGYEDVSYFIRFFKKHTGYSPEAFRHNFR